MDWITSWPSVIIGSVGLIVTYCLVVRDEYQIRKGGEGDEERGRKDERPTNQ